MKFSQEETSIDNLRALCLRWNRVEAKYAAGTTMKPPILAAGTTMKPPILAAGTTMKPPILLVHPDRFRQILESAGGLAHPAPLFYFDPHRQLVGIEIHQSSYVPLTTSVKQPRPWWAVWRPKLSVVEKSILGWWFTERGDGKIVEALPSRETELQL